MVCGAGAGGTAAAAGGRTRSGARAAGGGGTAPKWGTWYAALAKARNTNRAGQWTCVMHPYAWYHLGTAVAAAGAVVQTNAPDLQNQVMRDFWVGRVNGVDIYTSTYCQSGGTAVYGALFEREAIALEKE